MDFLLVLLILLIGVDFGCYVESKNGWIKFYKHKKTHSSKVPTMINRRLHKELFCNHCDISLTFHKDFVEIRALRNSQHYLKCRKIDVMANFVEKINPKRMKIVVENEGTILDEFSSFCDAVLELERLETIIFHLNSWTQNDKDEIVFGKSSRKLLEYMPDKITEFSGLSAETLLQFKKRKTLDILYIPFLGNKLKIEFAKLFHTNSKNIVLDSGYTLSNLDFDKIILRLNRNLESLSIHVLLAPNYTTIEPNKNVDSVIEVPENQLQDYVNKIASLSVLSGNAFLKIFVDNCQLGVKDGVLVEDIMEALDNLLDNAKWLLDSIGSLNVKLKQFHLKPTINLGSNLITNTDWMRSLIDSLISEFNLKKYSTNGVENKHPNGYFQFQGYMLHSTGQQITITLTICSKNDILHRVNNSGQVEIVEKLVDLIQKKVKVENGF